MTAYSQFSPSNFCLLPGGVRAQAKSDLERLQQARAAELHYIEEQNRLEIEKATKLTEIEVNKFSSMVNTIKPETLVAMAQAGPELQVHACALSISGGLFLVLGAHLLFLCSFGLGVPSDAGQALARSGHQLNLDHRWQVAYQPLQHSQGTYWRWSQQ